jgi:bifunctional non-homologous end joining protein LigD
MGAPVGQVEPARFTPMLCERAGAPLAAPGWIYELKLDGVRIVADVRSDIVKLFYRKARETTSSYPEVCDALARLDALGATRVVLDGEIVTFDAHGRPSFERLGQRFSLTRPADVKVAMRSVPVV